MHVRFRYLHHTPWWAKDLACHSLDCHQSGLLKTNPGTLGTALNLTLPSFSPVNLNSGWSPVDPVDSVVLGFFEELIYEMPNKTIHFVMRPVLAQGDSAIHSSCWVRERQAPAVVQVN